VSGWLRRDRRAYLLEQSETMRFRILRFMWWQRGEWVDARDIMIALGIGFENTEALNQIYTVLRRLSLEGTLKKEYRESESWGHDRLFYQLSPRITRKRVVTGCLKTFRGAA